MYLQLCMKRSDTQSGCAAYSFVLADVLGVRRQQSDFLLLELWTIALDRLFFKAELQADILDNN